MATVDRLTVYQTILDGGLVPLFFNGDVEVAKKVVAACIEGGAPVVEFTNRGEGAVQVFAALQEYARKANPRLILGVGSVIDAPTAALYLAHGANFIVAPNFEPEVARLCNRRQVGYVPGCATVNEISTAQEAGMEIIKVFPGNIELIKAILGPMPWSRLMPTGGVEVSQESVEKWIKAGAACLGVGSQLISKQAMANGDYAAIKQGVENMLAWIKAARAKK